MLHDACMLPPSAASDLRMMLNRYFGLGSAWAYYIYFAFGQQLFPSGNKPAWTDILEQMKVRCWPSSLQPCPLPIMVSMPVSIPHCGVPCSQVATLAIPLYSVLPAVGEYMIEEVSGASSAAIRCKHMFPEPHSPRVAYLSAAGLDEGVFEDQRYGRRRILGLLCAVHGICRVRHILDASAPARHPAGLQASHPLMLPSHLCRHPVVMFSMSMMATSELAI